MKRCSPIKPIDSLRLWFALLVCLALGGRLSAELVDSGRGAERSNQLYREGEELTVKGDYAGALAKYEASRKIAEKQGDRKTVADDWIGIGYVKMVRGEYAQAMELFQAAKKIAEEIGEKRTLTLALTRIGNIYDRQGHYRESIASYEDALRIGEQGPYKQEIGITLNSLGSAYYRQGNYAPAVECFQKALKVVEEAGDQRGLAQTLNNLAGMYRAQGFYGKAAEYYRRSLKIKEALQDKWGIKNTVHNIGLVYYSQGLYGPAIEYMQRSLKIVEELGDKRGIAEELNNIAVAYLAQGSYAQALPHLQRALQLVDELGDKRVKAFTLHEIGMIYRHQGNDEEALRYYQAALALSRELEIKNMMADALNSMGYIYRKRQQYPSARAAVQQALTISQEIGAPRIIWTAHYYLAGVYEKLGDPTQALNHCQAAITEIEKVRAGAGSDEGKAGFFQEQVEVYKRACALLLTLHEKDPTRGYDQQAIAYVERARARALVDRLTEISTHLNKKLSPGLQEKEKNLLARLSSAHRKLRRPEPGASRDALTAEIKQLEAEHDQLKEEIRQQDPTYANLVYPQPYTLEQIRAHLLDRDTVLLEYLLDEEQSLVYLVGREELVIRRLPGRPRIEERITAFLDAVQAPAREAAAVAALQTASRNLYQDLVAPIADRLARYRRVIIAADGGLYYLPFEALGAPNKAGLRYLIEDHEISYVPSATALGELLRRPRNRTEPAALLALGNPDLGQKEEMADAAAAEAVLRDLYDSGFRLNALPFTGEEVQQIARYFRRSQVRVRGEASEDFIKHTALENYRVIHFATHGWLDEQNPKASSIVLSLAGQGPEDGFLQVREIYDLKLNADLVVLSACNTGRGRLIHGEGIMGLTRAFFYAGTRSVLSSLWSVKDRSTADFMNQLYYHLQKGDGKAEALRAAKRAFLRSPDYQHPYYWAAFVLQGEPQETLTGNRRGVRELLAVVAGLLVIGLYSWRFLRKHAAGHASRPV